MKNNNFLIRQYNTDQKKSLKHNYLAEQFSDYSKIFKDIEKVVKKGDYTLGDQVVKFEKNISKITGSKYALGVGNGTDALYLVLKAFNIGKGDEVITTPFTFIATTASIATAGAKPVFADVKEDYNIDENKIEKLITKKTKAIMPVHWSGRPCEMDKIRKIANKYKLKIIQDSCHAIQSKFKDRNIVEFGDACTFSMHPLKNLNVWGDGGFIITNNKTQLSEYAESCSEHLENPAVINSGHYTTPLAPGYSAKIKPESIDTYSFPLGSYWSSLA